MTEQIKSNSVNELILKIGTWDNCKDCNLFREMNLWRFEKLICMDCYKKLVRICYG